MRFVYVLFELNFRTWSMHIVLLVDFRRLQNRSINYRRHQLLQVQVLASAQVGYTLYTDGWLCDWMDIQGSIRCISRENVLVLFDPASESQTTFEYNICSM